MCGKGRTFYTLTLGGNGVVREIIMVVIIHTKKLRCSITVSSKVLVLSHCRVLSQMGTFMQYKYSKFVHLHFSSLTRKCHLCVTVVQINW